MRYIRPTVWLTGPLPPRLLAEMFSDKGSELATQNKQLWSGFLRRFNDIEAAVRAECVSTCKNFILHHLKLSDVSY